MAASWTGSRIMVANCRMIAGEREMGWPETEALPGEHSPWQRAHLMDPLGLLACSFSNGKNNRLCIDRSNGAQAPRGGKMDGIV